MKSLKDISWNVTEEEYRQDKALSYSTLARFKREGFNNLSSLFSPLSTPSLTFGSAVDSMITGGKEEFDERFMVIEFPDISDTLKQIANTLYTLYHNEYLTVSDIPDEILAQVGKDCDFYANPKYKNYRVKLIREQCNNYYNVLRIAEGKQILDTDTYNSVISAVNTLYSNSVTAYYFNTEEPNVERLYQLKFKDTINGIPYRCMADLLICDHINKVITPVDLKTSSKPEWDFYKSFVEWKYDIQARLYHKIIRNNLLKDDYFKDFKLLDYEFIVINKKTLTPLVWVFPLTQAEGNVKIGNTEFTNPLAIGEELYSYLQEQPNVPKGIHTDNINNLKEWIEKL
jgi:hypothetical protein